MTQHYTSVKVVSKQLEKRMLSKCRNPKHRLMILLMLDAGLRESEVVQLRIKHIDVHQNQLTVRSLKKRDQQKEIMRYIPLTERILDAFADYIKTFKKPLKEAYLFPAGGKSESEFLNRKQVWRVVKKLSDGQVYPHMLRHTFATNLRSANCKIDTAQKLLGHADRKTTEIYWHIPEKELRSAIHALDREGRSFWYFIRRKLFPRTLTYIPETSSNMANIHVGRVSELLLLEELGTKKVNAILLGSKGVGKSHLLDRYTKGNIIRIDDMGSAKSLLAGMLLEIYKDKENLVEILHPNSQDQNDLGKIITRKSIRHLSKELIKITGKAEYSLLIDDVTRITPSGISAIEKLNNHFHIICAARMIPVSKASFLSNFQKIELKELNRNDSIKLIQLASTNFQKRIEDFEAFKNHVYENTNGNPQFILEMLDRYSKEIDLSTELIKDFRHNLALREIDMSLPIVITISSMMVFRYIGGEFGDDSGAFRFIGGFFLVFGLFARTLLHRTQRRNL